MPEDVPLSPDALEEEPSIRLMLAARPWSGVGTDGISCSVCGPRLLYLGGW